VNVKRITDEGLSMILHNQVKRPVNCVIKFYSNDCHLCHTLSEYFTEISEDEKYENLHFLACNMADCLDIEKKLNFSGVPTIFVIHSNVGNRKPILRLLPEPEQPNHKTWYKVSDIKKFINKEAL